jgi:hypothetical protein
MSGGGHAAAGHGGGLSEGIVGKLVDTVDLTQDKADVFAKLLHANESSGPWNTEMINIARKASVKIKEVMNETRDALKEALWTLPGQIGKKLLKGLSKPVFTIPAWLWTKTTQIPTNLSKLVFSGILVANAELWKALDAPARLMIKTHEKVQGVIDGLGGGGHGHAAAAHH